MTEELAVLSARAREHGVEVSHKDCPLCGTVGAFFSADPLDLRRLRESKGYNKSTFTNMVRKPDGSRVTIAFIAMVENPDLDHRDSRRCPDWLLKQYLEIPPAAETAKKTGPKRRSLEELATVQDKLREVGLRAAEGRKAKERMKREVAKHDAPKKGSVWKGKKTKEPPYYLVEVVGVAWPAVLIRERGEEEQTPRRIRVDTLHKNYEELAV